MAGVVIISQMIRCGPGRQSKDHDCRRAVFKPDDPTVLVSAGLDGAVWQWDVSLATWQQRACVIAGRDLTAQEWHRYVGDEPYRSTCSTLAGGR